MDGFIEKLAPHALGRLPTLYNTFDLCLKTIDQNIKGDFAECGIAYGAHPAIMEYACEVRGVERNVHMFDSFIGIPMGGPNDGRDITDSVGISLKGIVPSGISACSVNNVMSNLASWKLKLNNFKVHEGWFQDTVKTCDIESLAVLRLDGDLYESTKVCLDHLYDKISYGGWIIIDDYVLHGCKLAVHEFLDKHGLKPKILRTVDSIHTVAYWQIDELISKSNKIGK